MSKEVTLDYFDFFETFKPLKNPYDDNAAESGCMFETYGEELAHVITALKADDRKIWTVVTNDSEDVCIVNGFHFVNRLGYLITEKPADSDTYYYVE